MNECFANTSTPFSSIRRSATCCVCVYDGALHHIESSCASVAVHTWHLHYVHAKCTETIFFVLCNYIGPIFLRAFIFHALNHKFFPSNFVRFPLLLRGVHSIQIFHHVNFLPATFCACVWNENNKYVEWAHILNGARDDFIFAERSAAHATHTTNKSRNSKICVRNVLR